MIIALVLSCSVGSYDACMEGRPLALQSCVPHERPSVCKAAQPKTKSGDMEFSSVEQCRTYALRNLDKAPYTLWRCVETLPPKPQPSVQEREIK